jgi:hypothetical protein
MKGTTALIFLTTLTVAGGCAGASPRAASPTATHPALSTTASPATTAASPASTTATTAVTATTTQARQITAVTNSATTATREPAVPPVPVVTGIRYAAHDGFDRIVFDIPGAPPGHSAKYVTEVTRDGSGQPVAMPGRAFLLIVLHPAQAHRADGSTTVTGIHRTGLTGIKAYAVVGDYEGYVSIALGLSGRQKYHVGELSNRIYVDVTR